MRLSIGLIAAVLAAGSLCSGTFAAPKARVLVYSGSTGYRHESIPAAVAALKGIAEKSGYAVDTSEDPEVFTADNLARYKVLVLVSNSTDPKKPESEWFVGPKRDALQGFLAAGKTGDGSVPAFKRIRDKQYQIATVAEPLNLQGWIMIDEINRAFAGQKPSGYVPHVHLFTADNIEKDGGKENKFDPGNGYRNEYKKIWGVK